MVDGLNDDNNSFTKSDKIGRLFLDLDPFFRECFFWCCRSVEDYFYLNKDKNIHAQPFLKI